MNTVATMLCPELQRAGIGAGPLVVFGGMASSRGQVNPKVLISGGTLWQNLSRNR